MRQTNIWWIRRDLRLQDNQTLITAISNTEFFIPLFILEQDLMEKAAPKRKAFLLNALADLDQQLKAFGSSLVIRNGPALPAFKSLTDELGEVKIFAQEDFSPFARKRDASVSTHFNLQSFPGVTLRHPTEVLKADGEPYTVYTPFKNKWYENYRPMPNDCLTIPQALPPIPDGIRSEKLPVAEQVTGFPASAQEAQTRLREFTSDHIHHYNSRRNRLDLEGTSKLSPYLRFGLISAREAFVQSQIACLRTKQEQAQSEIQTWMNELVWREFYTTILYHFPRVMDRAFRKNYQDIHWRDAPEELHAWQAGETGYPIVDACMHQLKKTGWMHNRGRMIVASFLTKDLLINWQAGEAWFMANLVDGDPAANNGGWQWTAGTGTDAAPYFRIFNPMLQGKKFDPVGSYIAHWLPKFRDLPDKFRHEPWKMTEIESKNYNFRLGRDYPHRLVDHSFARQRTLHAYKSVRR